MSGWVGEAARILDILADEIKSYIFSAKQIHGDDTPVRVLAPGVGKTKIGRIWAYVVDGRPYGDKMPPAVCYFYSPDRKGSRPEEHLKDFKGIFHADAYSGYNGLYTDDKKISEIEEAGCWAHTRRKFHEVTVVNDNASIAIAVLDSISEIYQIETNIRGYAPEVRKEQRQEKSLPLINKLFDNFHKAYKQLPKKSLTAKAIKYALNNEIALKRFLDNGRIEIDNNAAERAMRPIAVGRKNWLFAGSDQGGHTASIIYTIVETAKLNQINPWKYLSRVFELLPDYKANKVHELLPWNLKIV